MFDISWTELLVIAVVAIVVIGPKDLPRALRVLGQWSGKIKKMAREFQSQFTEAIREAELDAVQRDLENLTKIDPVADLRAAATKTGEDIRRDLEKTTPTSTPTATPAQREPYPWETVAQPPEATAAEVAPQPAAPPVAPQAAPQPAVVEQKP
jgi:sec-independent protein translocase protein TatB